MENYNVGNASRRSSIRNRNENIGTFRKSFGTNDPLLAKQIGAIERTLSNYFHGPDKKIADKNSKFAGDSLNAISNGFEQTMKEKNILITPQNKSNSICDTILEAIVETKASPDSYIRQVYNQNVILLSLALIIGDFSYYEGDTKLQGFPSIITNDTRVEYNFKNIQDIRDSGLDALSKNWNISLDQVVSVLISCMDAKLLFKQDTYQRLLSDVLKNREIKRNLVEEKRKSNSIPSAPVVYFRISEEQLTQAALEQKNNAIFAIQDIEGEGACLFRSIACSLFYKFTKIDLGRGINFAGDYYSGKSDPHLTASVSFADQPLGGVYLNLLSLWLKFYVYVAVATNIPLSNIDFVNGITGVTSIIPVTNAYDLITMTNAIIVYYESTTTGITENTPQKRWYVPSLFAVIQTIAYFCSQTPVYSVGTTKASIGVYGNGKDIPIPNTMEWQNTNQTINKINVITEYGLFGFIGYLLYVPWNCPALQATILPEEKTFQSVNVCTGESATITTSNLFELDNYATSTKVLQVTNVAFSSAKNSEIRGWPGLVASLISMSSWGGEPEKVVLSNIFRTGVKRFPFLLDIIVFVKTFPASITDYSVYPQNLDLTQCTDILPNYVCILYRNQSHYESLLNAKDSPKNIGEITSSESLQLGFAIPESKAPITFPRLKPVVTKLEAPERYISTKIASDATKNDYKYLYGNFFKEEQLNEDVILAQSLGLSLQELQNQRIQEDLFLQNQPQQQFTQPSPQPQQQPFFQQPQQPQQPQQQLIQQPQSQFPQVEFLPQKLPVKNNVPIKSVFNTTTMTNYQNSLINPPAPIPQNQPVTSYQTIPFENLNEGKMELQNQPQPNINQPYQPRRRGTRQKRLENPQENIQTYPTQGEIEASIANQIITDILNGNIAMNEDTHIQIQNIAIEQGLPQDSVDRIYATVLEATLQ